MSHSTTSSLTSSGSGGSHVRSALQPYIDHAGSFATTPYPAYSLASLFALSAPFGFAGGRDLQRLPQNIPGQAALKNVVGKTVASALRPSSLPPFWQLAGFAAAVAGGGYIIDQGDLLNGTGTVTGEHSRLMHRSWAQGVGARINSRVEYIGACMHHRTYMYADLRILAQSLAWSGIYLFFNGLSSLRRPSLLPLLLSTSTLTVGAAVHGSYYFSRTSWKGAIPGLQQQKQVPKSGLAISS